MLSTFPKTAMSRMAMPKLRMHALAMALLVPAIFGAMNVPAAATEATTDSTAGEMRGFTADDLVRLQRVSAVDVSPDGRHAVYVLRSTDMDADRGRTDLWLVATDGSGEPRRLTTHQASDSEPHWAVDGKGVYFLSSRSGSSQVWYLPLAGGEAQQVTDLPLDAANLVLSPDGQRLAVTMQVFLDCDGQACSPQQTADRLAAAEADPAEGRLYDRVFVRHWDSWKDGRRSHLFVLPLGDSGKAGDAVDVSASLDADIPSKPFGGAEEITFTPDGSGVVFAARTAGGQEPWSTDFDLFHVAVDSAGQATEPRNLTPNNAAWITSVSFTPDGKHLAYLNMKRPGYEADRWYLKLRAWPDGAPGSERIVAEDFDRSFSSYFFSADGGTVYGILQDTGRKPLFAIDVASGKVTKLVAGGYVSDAALAGDRLIFGLRSLQAPVDLWTVPVTGGEPSRLTEVNRERLASIDMGQSEQFSFEGAGGDTVYGWVTRPAGFEAGNKYPVAFLIHGGPQGSFGDDFHYRWNPQTYAGAGYAVVTVDFHGSTGYGQDFTDAINQNYGGGPLEDLQKGLAAALDKYDFLDGERVGALGASYGGYMINWIAGTWPDRFRCLVNHDGIFDARMMYYGTEELWFPEWDYGGPYYDVPENHEKWNPVHHVDKWQTPMLVIHGARDFRVPITQGLAAFNTLQRRGIESQLLVYENENHWVLSPANSVQWHSTVNAWLDRFLK